MSLLLTAEIAADALYLLIQSVICLLQYRRYRSSPKHFHLWQLVFQSAYLVSLCFGTTLTVLVSTLPEQYNTLLKTDMSTNTSVWKSYQNLYFIQLLVSCWALIGMLHLSLNRFEHLHFMVYMRPSGSKYLVAISWCLFLYVFAMAIYNSYIFETLEDWQRNQGLGPFHLFHGLFFMLVCGFDLSASMFNTSLLGSLRGRSDVFVRDMLPAYIPLIMGMDCANILLAAGFHLWTAYTYSDSR
ncbi:hypothetical protein EDD86DRAFT_207879 [Gorgonomyces haynaldii]|nr:hypothetical protein EDD86DRAFT_207879 [Gorgonomyces haynaldii]